MRFIGWMYDIAREQSPSAELLADLLSRSQEAGYNAVGLYLEHRFAYSSAPWAAGPGCLTPGALRQVFDRLGGDRPRVIPFLNTLGHMEGFIRSEGGQWLAEGPAAGSLQICPSRTECVEFARNLVADALEAFDDEWIHLGGDETRQLGQCPRCAERAESIGKAGIYAEYFGPLCRWVLERGRRPCLWGDMLIQHPAALDAIPRETIIFDWQYESRPAETTKRFRERGFDVVCCPSIQTYNAGWCFLEQSQRNIDEHAEDARALGAQGVLVTTWELSHFTQYASILPLIRAAGRRLSAGTEWREAVEQAGGDEYARAAEILGNRVPAAADFLGPGTWRQLRDRFVVRQNPFYLWRDWRSAACGEAGTAILHLCDQASAPLADDNPLQFAIELHRVAVEWVRLVERSYQLYAHGRVAACAAELETGVDLLARLGPGLEQAVASGGSRADPVRLERLLRAVERVCATLSALPADAAQRPAFEVLIEDRFVNDDQASWGL